MSPSAVTGPDDAGARLDVFVAGLAGISRARAASAIEAGQVTVDGQVPRKSMRLEPGMLVEVAPPAAPEAEEEPRAEAGIDFGVVHEDEHLLVVSKPAGLVVHPAPGHRSGTLVNALLHRASRPRGGSPYRPGIVHRLDVGTSGLMIVAKDPAAHETLTRMLGERLIHRTYAALVEGAPRTDTLTIEGPVGRDPRNRTKMAVVASGRDALTRASVVERLEDAALLDVEPHTGRTHQIRVHMSASGHPIAGDLTYGASGPFAARLGLDRPFLHARALEFDHPASGAQVRFEDPLPPDLAAALTRARPAP